MNIGHSIADSGFVLPTAEQVWRVLLLEDYNTRVVILGVMALGIATGLVGTFLLLRKRALTADALSHATLPGISIAFLVMVALGMQGKSMFGLLLGAFVFGCIGVLLILGIRRTTRLKDDAAIGIVLSVLFGLGLCLLRLATEMPSGNSAGLNGFIFGKAASMVARDTTVIAIVAFAAAIIVSLLRKELTSLCFDEQHGASQGWPVVRLDLVLMTLVAVVTVLSLQSVGLVLAVAMLIVPAASARYWCTTVGRLLIASAIIGCLGGWAGGVVSALVPRMPTGPIIVLVCGGWFVFSCIFGPVNGIVVRYWRLHALNRRIAKQHILRAMYEAEHDRSTNTIDQLVGCRVWSRREVARLTRMLERKGLAISKKDGFQLTPKGTLEAARVVRNHRLWEVYLINFADIAPNHVDRDADMIEHVLGERMVEQLEQLLGTEEIQSPHPLGAHA
ncbi:MAG: iron chelate uptake ABC transporter family permease subunit [Phycisphaerales bacterium]|nr:iron chelate uptake ABC transporter family permease subunit [Phycisphaerales bacterium]